MGRHLLNIALGVALVVSIGLNISARLSRTRLNFEYFPNMARTPRYNAFEANPNFADGATLRTPAPGTIPRGLPPVVFTDDATALVNPFSSEDRRALERGALVFANFCAPCHGASGRGEGLVVKHGFPPPPPLSGDKTQRKTDTQLFQVVTNGQNTMPPYASLISRDDRWKVVLHVRALGPPSQAGAK